MKYKNIVWFAAAALLASCDSESPLDFVKKTTLNDTYEYCMNLHGNKKYCGCEMADLKKSFPWGDYMDAVDALAGEENHVAAVMARHGGDRAKTLAELNCKKCHFETAMSLVQVSPSPRCKQFLPGE
ncbi:MAG: hypothetical protein LBB08_00015 [Rickettsiales bacterium]|nr:hypothetical protein [Rickettsiales bacterium]